MMTCYPKTEQANKVNRAEGETKRTGREHNEIVFPRDLLDFSGLKVPGTFSRHREPLDRRSTPHVRCSTNLHRFALSGPQMRSNKSLKNKRGS